MSLMYIKPWSRIGAYIIGWLFGLGIFELKMKEKHPELKNTLSNLFYDKLQNSRVLSIACAVFGAGLTALYVFPIGDAYANWKDSNCWPLFFSSLYGATFRPFFVLGVGLIIAPTIVGRLRFLINFLGSETFAVLARLNYSVYLWHIGKSNHLHYFYFVI